jgi:hypothetical protein
MMIKQTAQSGSRQRFNLWQWLLRLLQYLFGSEDKEGGPKLGSKTAATLAANNTNANWNSVFKTMDHWVDQRPELVEQVPSGMLQLAGEARYFAHKYASFLSDVIPQADEADEWSTTKLRTLALEKVLEEWDTIRHALEQRENPRYQKTLAELDRLALECLAPIFDEKKLQRGVYAYFHKLFDIKRFVFSRIPLVGAPFSALHSPEDWLAIPHEAGHYLFWNGTDTFAGFNRFYVDLQDQLVAAVNSRIENRISGRPLHHKGEIFQVWLNWLNEIFADVFGTLVAGPAFAWSMQSNLRASLSVRDLLHSHAEHDHPDAFIRPFFHITTLREMAKEANPTSDFAVELRTVADALELSWRASWPEDITTKLPTPDSVGSMEKVLSEEVPAIVLVILDAALGENLPFTLRQYFRKGSLYNREMHQEVVKAAREIQRGQKPANDSPVGKSALKKSIAACLAIVNGMDSMDVHRVLGYPGSEEEPPPNAALEQDFERFLANITGQTSRPEQRKAFRRVLNYSLQEQDFHGHNHPHYH